MSNYKEVELSEKVANEQAKEFEKMFVENSIDGISAIINISSDLYREPNAFYEKYIPKGYIKVCERNCPFTRLRHETVFIRQMDAKGQVITLKVKDDSLNGLIIGKSGSNIKRIAQKINSPLIKVI